jgi:hypothetical protein
MANKTERAATNAERQKTAFELARAGLPWEEVAEGAGYASRGAAYNAVKTYITKMVKPVASEYLAMSIARFDDLLAGLYEAARNGDLFAVDRALKIEDQRARLLGLYEQKPEDPTAEVRGALLDFAAGLKGLFGPADSYGQVSDDPSGTVDVPVDSEPGA